MTEKTSEILNRAADEIQKYGWTTGVKGWYRERNNGGLCVEGGILAAMGEDYRDVNLFEFMDCPAYQAVKNYLELNHEEARLYEWNDSIGVKGAQSGEHVIEVLRGAALVEAAKEAELESVSA